MTPLRIPISRDNIPLGCGPNYRHFSHQHLTVVIQNPNRRQQVYLPELSFSHHEGSTHLGDKVPLLDGSRPIPSKIISAILNY